jgi:hypothetical protein
MYQIVFDKKFPTLNRAPTTLKSEGEVTSLSGADKREVVRVQGEVKIFP